MFIFKLSFLFLVHEEYRIAIRDLWWTLAYFGVSFLELYRGHGVTYKSSMTRSILTLEPDA